MGHFIGDIRLAVRRLRRSPGFASSALLILILSIGANSTIFTVVNRYLLEPLPVSEPNRLVSLEYRAGSNRTPTFSYPDYLDLRDRNNVLEGLAAFTIGPASLSHHGSNARRWAYMVSGNYFDVLGVKPLLGRVITQEDDERGNPRPVVVLTYSFWQQQFAGNPGVVGTTLKLNGRDYTIAGITPAGFYGTERIFSPEVFFPIHTQQGVSGRADWLDSRAERNVMTVGRLKPGGTAQAAQAALSAIAAQIAAQYPAENEGMQVLASEPGLFGTLLRGPFLGAAALLLVLAGAVLLVACANIAGLLLARASGRSKETAIRIAIGATRGRLVSEVLTESLVLSVLAGAGGVLLALWLAELISGWAPPIPVPIIPQLTVDSRVLALSTLATLVAGMLCGLAPAFQSTRTDITEALKYQRGSGWLSRWRMQDFLVGGQVALSMILLIGSLLVASSLRKTLDIPIGFDPENAASLAFELPLEGYDSARAANFRRDLLGRVKALPGVESAALAGSLPLTLDGARGPVHIEGEPLPTRDATVVAGYYYAGEGYFHTMRTRLEAGREFEERDDTANVAIVNRAFVERLLPNRSPLGARFKIDDGPWREVVGVAQDGKYTWVNEAPLPVAFLPVAQATGMTTIVARSAGASSGLLQQLRTTTLSLDPSISIFYDGPLARRVDLQLFPARFLAASLGSFGIVAILLVGAGLYGSLAYAVSQHTKEIGIRMALGAAPSSVVRTMTVRAVSLAVAGMLAGVGGGLALGRLFAVVLYGIDPYDPLTITLAVVLMTGVGLFACWIPVRRAINVDPLVALRAD